MSNVQQNAQTKGKPSTASETAWVDDDRSLPMFRAKDSLGKTIEGWIGEAVVLGSDEPDEKGKSQKFGAYIVKLTASCECYVNDEPKTIEAGKEIFVPVSADLRDLVNVAFSRDEVFRYRLTPVKEQKIKGGFRMIVWKRQRDPVARKRSEIFPNRPAALILTPTSFAKMMTEGAGIGEDPTTFDVKALEA